MILGKKSTSTIHTVDRITEIPTPITIEVYQLGKTNRTTFRCDDGNITDVVKIVFAEGCQDPVVIVNKTATVNLSVELEVKFSYMDMVCNTILIGPQREYTPAVHVECYASLSHHRMHPTVRGVLYNIIVSG